MAIMACAAFVLGVISERVGSKVRSVMRSHRSTEIARVRTEEPRNAPQAVGESRTVSMSGYWWVLVGMIFCERIVLYVF